MPDQVQLLDNVEVMWTEVQESKVWEVKVPVRWQTPSLVEAEVVAAAAVAGTFNRASMEIT